MYKINSKKAIENRKSFASNNQNTLFPRRPIFLQTK